MPAAREKDVVRNRDREKVVLGPSAPRDSFLTKTQSHDKGNANPGHAVVKPAKDGWESKTEGTKAEKSRNFGGDVPQHKAGALAQSRDGSEAAPKSL